ADTDPTEALARAVDSCTRVVDVAVATEAAAQRALWRYREGHSEAINLLGSPLKLDVSLPAAQLGEFLSAVPARVAAVASGAAVWMFGHAGDGNVHVNVTGSFDADTVTAAVFELVADLHGSISAEHGIGTAKREYLALVRSPEEI